MGPLGLSLVGQRSLRWRVEIKKHRGSDLGGLSAHLNREGPEQWRSGPSLFPVPKGVTFSETSTEFSLGKTVTCIRNRHMYPKPSHVSETVTRLGAGHTFGCGSHVWAYRAGGTPPAPPAQPAPPDASENTSILLPGLPQLRVLAPAGHEFVVGTELREVAINHDGHAVSIMRGVKPMRDGDDRASL